MNRTDRRKRHRTNAIEKFRAGLLMFCPDEAAALAGYHTESVRRAIRAGHLKGTRPEGADSLRITGKALEGWLGVPLHDLIAKGAA